MAEPRTWRWRRIRPVAVALTSFAAILASSCSSTPGAGSSVASSPVAVSTAPTAAVTAAQSPSGTGSVTADAAGSCPAIDTPDTATAAGWLGYLAAHPGDIGLVVNDGRGTIVEYRQDDPAPAASAAKVVHLTAYARAIDGGTLDPDEPVRVADWEAWYLPGLDGGAHPQALQALGVPNDGFRSTDPNATVRWDDMVTAMIRFSDNAAPDLLRERLGDEALLAVATEVGWPGSDLPTYLGSQILMLRPELAPDVSLAERSATEWGLAKRYAGEPAFAAEIQSLTPPPLAEQLALADATAVATPAALERLHRTVSEGASGAAPPGAVRAREQLEWNPPPEGTLGLGIKGGALPGVITEGLTIRRTDGSTASAVLMVRGMPEAAWTAALQSFAHQELLAAAMQDRTVLHRLSCAVDQGSTIPR